jgi:hypothetical protein
LSADESLVRPPPYCSPIPSALRRSFCHEFPAAPHIQLANFNPVSACARSIADQFLNAPTIIAAVDGKGMTRLTGIVSTTRDLGL